MSNELFTTILLVQEAFVDALFNVLTAPVQDTFIIFFVLAFVFYGLKLVIFSGQGSVSDFGMFIIKFAVLYGIVASTPTIKALVYDPVVQIPDGFAGTFTQALMSALAKAGGGHVDGVIGNDPFEVFDNMARNISRAGEEYGKLSGSGWTYKAFMTGLVNFTIQILLVIMVAVAVMLITGAKIASSILLGLAPIYIMLAFFPQSRQFTMSWVGALVYLMLIQILTYGYMVFGGLVGSQIGDQTLTAVGAAGDAQVSLVFPLLVMMVAVSYAMSMIPSQAQQLSGSIGLGGFNPGAFVNSRMLGAAYSATNRTSEIAQETARLVLKGGGRLGMGAWNSLTGPSDPSNARSKAEREAQTQMKVREHLRGFDRNN